MAGAGKRADAVPYENAASNFFPVLPRSAFDARCKYYYEFGAFPIAGADGVSRLIARAQYR